MRRRIVGRGFEGFELPQSRGWRPSADDMDLLQGQEMPRRRLVSQGPVREQGPVVRGQAFSALGTRDLLDEALDQNLGRSVDYPLVYAAGPVAANILNLGGPDKKAQVLTITLDRQWINPAAGNFVSWCWAVVTWGSGGVQYEARVDFQSGAVFQVCCSSLRINVKAIGNGTIRCSAHVGYGAVGEKTAQFTNLTGPIEMGATDYVEVPAFARSYQIQRNPSTANFTLQHWDRRMTTVLSEVMIGNGPGSGLEEILIPSGCEYIQLTNGLAARITVSRFIFRLHL